MLKGLSDSEDKQLIIKHNAMGRGVYSQEAIFEKEYVCEYECKVYKSGKRGELEKEYISNGEGSFILEGRLPSGQKMCFDATRTVYSYGRLINHSINANIRPYRPLNVNGKWRIGFYSLRDIQPGEELFYDYGAGHIKESPLWMKRVSLMLQSK